MNVRFLGALLLGVAGCAGQAWAHGGVSIDQGQCVMKIGPDTMTFTGYQPQKSREQFCDDIPDVGSTIIVLDAQQDELRDMALEIRILRNVGQKDDSENMDANTEIYVAPKKYKTGTLNFDYDFKQQGNFIGLVKARSDDGAKEYISRAFLSRSGKRRTRTFIPPSFLEPPVSSVSACITSMPSSTRRSIPRNARQSTDEAFRPQCPGSNGIAVPAPDAPSVLARGPPFSSAGDGVNQTRRVYSPPTRNRKSVRHG